MTLKFSLDQEVFIIPLDSIKGRVKSIWITNQGIKYEVRYFKNADDRQVYFYEDELSNKKK